MFSKTTKLVVKKYCKIRKYRLAKLTNFVYFCITREEPGRCTWILVDFVLTIMKKQQIATISSGMDIQITMLAKSRLSLDNRKRLFQIVCKSSPEDDFRLSYSNAEIVLLKNAAFFNSRPVAFYKFLSVAIRKRALTQRKL